jgi:hypothetical protein
MTTPVIGYAYVILYGDDSGPDYVVVRVLGSLDKALKYCDKMNDEQDDVQYFYIKVPAEIGVRYEANKAE